MAQMVFQRLWTGLLVLFMVSVCVFFATQVLPGDAAQAILGRDATPERLEALRQQLQLSGNPIVQYWHWLGSVLQLDFGASLANGRPVADLLGARIGFSRLRTVVTEVLPNVVAPLMVEFGIRFTYSVGLVASLSFLGLGVQPPNPDWGNMINETRPGITIQPWGVILPLIALALLAIGCNLVTDCIGRAVGLVEARRKDG